MPNRNVSIDFEKFVEIFNNDGKPTAKKYIVQNKTEEVFISTDKLFEGNFISKDKQSTLNDKSISFNDILTDILKDRLT